MQNKFSPSDAAVSIFEFAKFHPKFVLQFISISAILTYINSIILNLSGFMEAQKSLNLILAKSKNNVDPAIILSAFENVNKPLLLISIVFGVLISSVLLSMALRKTILNTEKGYYGLQFGNDEKNLIAGTFGLILILILAYFSAIILGMLASFINQSLGVLLMLVAIIMICFIGFRFSLWGVYTIAENKIGIKSSFKSTETQYWSFFGAFFLASVIVIIISILSSALLTLIFGLGKILQSGSLSDPAILFNPKVIISSLINHAFSGFFQLMFVCTGSYAYHKINEQT